MVGVAQVVVLSIGARHEVGTQVYRVVGHGLYPGESDRRRGPRDEARRAHLRWSGDVEVGGAQNIAQLDLVDLQIAPDSHEHYFAVSHVEDRFERFRGRDVEEGCEIVDGPDARRVDLFQRLGGLYLLLRLHKLGLLGVRGVPA